MCLTCAVLLLPLFAGGCAYARLKTALVNDRRISSGDVPGITVVRTNKEGVEDTLTAKVRMELKKGDRVETDADTFGILDFPSEKARITLYPDSRVVLSSVLLKFGKALVELFVEGKKKLLLESGHAEMKARGTAYKIDLSSPDELILTVLQGTVDVVSKQTGKVARVHALHAVRMEGSERRLTAIGYWLGVR